MLLVAQFAFISVSFTRLEALGRWVVLDDEVIPIDHPNVSIGADFGHRRSGPFVHTRDQVERARASVASTHSIENIRSNTVTRRFANKRQPVPPLFRIVPGSVKCVASSGCVRTELVHLPNLFGDCGKVRIVCDGWQNVR